MNSDSKSQDCDKQNKGQINVYAHLLWTEFYARIEMNRELLLKYFMSS